VVFDGRDQENVDESAPYPARFMAHYPRTKAEAERMMIDANGDGLVTVSLRPHLIWGPGDPHLAPRVIERARAGGLRLVGGGTKKVDAVYVENAATAHLLAADAGDHVGGKAYFVTNREPIAMRDLINGILAAADQPPVTRSVSPCVAYGVGVALECVYAALAIKSEPLTTRFVTRQLATAHWYDITAARRDLGYEPIVSMDEGMRRLAGSFGK
jgi:nucleoside-diphosphate-sugar epimerase